MTTTRCRLLVHPMCAWTYFWMLDEYPALCGRDRIVDLWWAVAKKLVDTKGIVPDGDFIWNRKDFD